MIRWRHADRRISRTASPRLALILGLALLLLAFWSTFEGAGAGSDEEGNGATEESVAEGFPVAEDSVGTRGSAPPLPLAAPRARTAP